MALPKSAGILSDKGLKDLLRSIIANYLQIFSQSERRKGY